MAVPTLIGRRIVEPEIRAQVDERDAEIEDRRCDRLAVTMGERGEDEIDVRQRGDIESLESRACINRREMRMHLRHTASGLAFAEQFRCAQPRVRGEKAQKLTADIARGSQDCCPNHRQLYPRICINMQ